MSITQQSSLHFNSQIVVTDNGKRVSSFGGLTLFREFTDAIHLDYRLRECGFVEWRRNPQHSMMKLASYAIAQRVCGFVTDTSANALRRDPVWQALWGRLLPSQASISRFYQTFRDNLPALAGLHRLSLSLANLKLNHTRGTLVFDMDSTNFNAYGHQEGVEFNGHYDKMGLHPFVVYEGRTGLLLDIELRSGAVYTSNNAENYMDQLLAHFADRNVILRGDSGFATPKIYDMASAHGADFVIRLKDNTLLKRLPPLVVANDPNFKLDGQEHFYSFFYQSPNWQQPHRLILMAKQNVEDLYPTYQYFITSLQSSAATVVQFYRKRGQMENYIKETKSGFFADRVSSHNFFVNEARMMIACLAYNIMQLMKLLVFPAHQRIWQIDTIRTHLLDIAASVATHARKTWINLTSSHPGLVLFWKILANTQRFRL